MVYFTSAYDAAAAGFRPCRRCRPDLLDDKEGWALVQRAQEMIAGGSGDAYMPARVAKSLGVNRDHLATLFLKYCGETPEQYRARLRIERTMEKIRRKLREPVGKSCERSAGYDSTNTA